MDESQPSEALPTVEENLPDQTDNGIDGNIRSSSPPRQETESENTTSPTSENTHLESVQMNSPDDNSENEERPSHRKIDYTHELETAQLQLQENIAAVEAMYTVNNESLFNCKYPGCNFSSGDAEAYLKHEDTHVDGGTVICDICNMRFPTYANMRRHHLYIHQGIRTFECQFCTKRFLRKEQYMEHLVAHSKPRPYQCCYCGGTFSYRGQLKSHLSAEHPNNDKMCNLCDFKGSSPTAVKLHYATFHLKQNMEVSDNDRPYDLIRRVQVVNPTENGAIDLATVSQNFSFMAAHYPSFSTFTSDSNTVVPGPSDLSRTSKETSLPSSAANPRNLMMHALERTAAHCSQEEDNRHTCESSLSASTTIVSSPSCQDQACSRPQISHVTMVPREKVCIKPEPPELIVDDSQNSNVQPTSTMDLTTTDVVETTCVTSEAGTTETPCRRKVHKHSSTDDTGSESRCSPSNRHSTESRTGPSASMKTAHTCCRFRPYEEGSSQRCREFSRHTCATRRHNDRRSRYSDSDVNRNVQNDHSDEERKVFYSRATSTNLLGPGEASFARVNRSSTLHGDGVSESHGEANYYNHKGTIVIRDIESCTLTCGYCGIIFPDQTLYFLHRSLHSEASPWKCNLCGKTCKDKYDFNSHVISKGHY